MARGVRGSLCSPLLGSSSRRRRLIVIRLENYTRALNSESVCRGRNACAELRRSVFGAVGVYDCHPCGHMPNFCLEPKTR